MVVLDALPADGRDPRSSLGRRVVRQRQLFDDPAAGGRDVAVAVLPDDVDELLRVVLEAGVRRRVRRRRVERQPLRHGGGAVAEGRGGRVRGHGGVEDGRGAVEDLAEVFAKGLVCSISGWPRSA